MTAKCVHSLCLTRACLTNEQVPQEPDSLNEEQTASLLAFGTFSYLDRLVMSGFHLQSLSFEQLPPLPDYDRTSYLVKRSFKVCLTTMSCCHSSLGPQHLDPFSRVPRRHIFIGILKTFCAYCSRLMVPRITHFVQFGSTYHLC